MVENKTSCLEMENLSVIYKDGDHALVALDRVTLSLKAGTVTALVGESGSGKTTIGNAIMGLLPPNAALEGNIRLHDTELTSCDEENYRRLRWQKVAMVFQNGAAGLNPVQRIVDQVAEPLVYHRNMKKDEAVRIAGELLAGLGLFAGTIRRFPHELSGGQAQRALFAMALILDPEVLILDEPTSAQDAALKGFIAGMIRKLREKGMAILLISHDLELAQKAADEAIMLYLGQIMEVLPASDLLLRPLHPYTRAIGRSFPAMDATRDLGGMRGDAFYRYTHVHRLKEGAVHPHVHIATGADREEGGHAPASGCLFRSRCTQAVVECLSAHVDLTPVGDHQVRCLRGGIVDLMRIDKTTKSYGGMTALWPTELAVHAGEALAIIGETGSGKTTLAMIAAGALDPDSGKREFAGRDMDEWIRKDRLALSAAIGIIYQSPSESVSHRFTAFDIVAEPLRIQKKNHAHAGEPGGERGSGHSHGGAAFTLVQPEAAAHAHSHDAASGHVHPASGDPAAEHPHAHSHDAASGHVHPASGDPAAEHPHAHSHDAASGHVHPASGAVSGHPHPHAHEDSAEGREEALRRRVLQAMADVHLPVEPDFLKRHPQELNMGTIQRLCIARALVHEPLLLVADEPTSALDPSVQAKVMKMLLNLQTEKGMTMLFVTHDIALARKISDRICVMLAGHIVEIGPAAGVLGKPAHPYTRGLIESARGASLMEQAAEGEAAAGCPFAGRCDRKTEECLRFFPSPNTLPGGARQVWCFHPLG
jgi:peptide/nickel transport system ATP-binding protein